MVDNGDDPRVKPHDTSTTSRAPLRLMVQFLRAVSESRMENALALARISERIGVKQDLHNVTRG